MNSKAVGGIPANTTNLGGAERWQRKQKVTLNCRSKLAKQHQLHHGLNIVQFTKDFNARTADQPGMIIPVVITVYQDKSFSFVTKTPPAAVLLKKACKIQKGAGNSLKETVATISKADLQQIAETKMQDLNAASIEAAMSMIAGTARSMGIKVED